MAVVMTTTIRSDEPIAVALINAIRGGDVDALEALLAGRPELASVALQGNRGTRAPLQVVTDWPGFFPNGPRIARMLLEAGADPDVVSPGEGFKETPLHWAASSDDVDVAAVLIDAGADLEAPGGSIAGTPLANAVGYGCWHVARLLRWSEYAPRVPEKPPHFERAWRVESLSPEQDAFLAGHCVRIEDLELARESLPPMAAGVPYWLVVHSGPASEVSELISFACEVRAAEGVRTSIMVITASAPAQLPADTQVCDVFPAHPYFANAKRIFSAAGFNTMRDAAAYRFKHSVLPMPRRLDDQFERARRAFADRGRPC